MMVGTRWGHELPRPPIPMRLVVVMVVVTLADEHGRPGGETQKSWKDNFQNLFPIVGDMKSNRIGWEGNRAKRKMRNGLGMASHDYCKLVHLGGGGGREGVRVDLIGSWSSCPLLVLIN